MSGQKILAVVLKGYPRLSETFIAQELLGLERAGFRLWLVSLRHPTDKKRHPVHDEIKAPVTYLPEYLYQEPGRVLRALVRALPRPGFWRALAAFGRDLIRDPTPNRGRRFGQALVLAAEWPADAVAIYAHFLHTPASVARYAAMVLGVPWAVSAHAKDIWTSPDWDLREKLGSVGWAVTCTRMGYEHLRALSPRPERVNLSYHGLDLTRFPHWQGTRGARDGADPADPVRLISVGRAVPKKGYDVLLHALALLPADLSWRFTHIGGGAELASLRALAEQLGLSGRIQWQGAQDQQAVLAAYRASDLFALDCKITPDGDRDGLPNVMVEAASQRLCCIGTTISGIPELFTDDETGLLVAPEDPAAMARALERAMRDPGLRARLGAAAEARVRRDFNAETSIHQLSALLRRLEQDS